MVKKPIPVFICVFPVPSRFNLTLISVSPVFLAIYASRPIFTAPFIFIGIENIMDILYIIHLT